MVICTRHRPRPSFAAALRLPLARRPMTWVVLNRHLGVIGPMTTEVCPQYRTRWFFAAALRLPLARRPMTMEAFPR